MDAIKRQTGCVRLVGHMLACGHRLSLRPIGCDMNSASAVAVCGLRRYTSVIYLCLSFSGSDSVSVITFVCQFHCQLSNWANASVADVISPSAGWPSTRSVLPSPSFSVFTSFFNLPFCIYMPEKFHRRWLAIANNGVLVYTYSPCPFAFSCLIFLKVDYTMHMRCSH